MSKDKNIKIKIKIRVPTRKNMLSKTEVFSRMQESIMWEFSNMKLTIKNKNSKPDNFENEIKKYCINSKEKDITFLPYTLLDYLKKYITIYKKLDKLEYYDIPPVTREFYEYMLNSENIEHPGWNYDISLSCKTVIENYRYYMENYETVDTDLVYSPRNVEIYIDKFILKIVTTFKRETKHIKNDLKMDKFLEYLEGIRNPISNCFNFLSSAFYKYMKGENMDHYFKSKYMKKNKYNFMESYEYISNVWLNANDL